MSAPDQEARALARVRDFMYDLGNGTYRVETITRLRADARAVMKHYPIADGHMSPHQRQAVETVIDTQKGVIGIHSESCWKRHAGCLATLLRDMEEQ
ncbi:MAG: hypothetical protein ACTH31_16950 [Pseudoclavibacter sp.]